MLFYHSAIPAQLPPKQNKSHTLHLERGRGRVKRGRSTTFALYCTHTALALAALQWTQLNGQQIWFICCFFCHSLPPFPRPWCCCPPSRSVYPQESDVSGAEAYAFDDFNNLMKVMSDWPTFQWLPSSSSSPPSPLSLFPLSPDDIRFRIHIH